MHSASVTGTSYTSPFALDPATQYYWRVTPSNACGDGVPSGTFTFTTGSTVSFDCLGSGANCNVSIPDGSPDGATSTITVPAGTCPLISDLDVSLQATHTWVGDLTFTLSHDRFGHLRHHLGSTRRSRYIFTAAPATIST